MMLTMLKTFPWHREVYVAGTDREVENEATAKQFVAAKLAKPADRTAAKALEKGTSVKPAGAKPPVMTRDMRPQQQSLRGPEPKATGSAPSSHVVTAMGQSGKKEDDGKAAQTEPKPADDAPKSDVVSAMTLPEKEDEDKAKTTTVRGPGAAPYRRRDLQSEKK